MKTWMIKLALALSFLTLSLSSPARAQIDNDGCTLATLHGDYAFTISGTFWTGPDLVNNAVQRAGIAMTHFDGMGGLTQVDFVKASPNAPALPALPPTDQVTGFHNKETGSYTVYSDCTGNFTIVNPDFVDTVIPGPVISVNFVISNGGREIHTVVTSLVVTTPAGKVSLPVLVRSDGYKVGPILDTLY